MSCNVVGDAGTYEIAAGLKHDKRLKNDLAWHQIALVQMVHDL